MAETSESGIQVSGDAAQLEHVDAQGDERPAPMLDVEGVLQAIEELTSAHRVWALAWGPAGTVRTMGPPAESDTPAQHLETLARAALTDAIAQLADGRKAGLEELVGAQLRAVMGGPEYAQLESDLRKLRDADANPMGSFNANLRDAVQELVNLGLPTGTYARDLISAICQPGAPIPDGLEPRAVPDRLFRDLITVHKMPLELAQRALDAATMVAFARAKRDNAS